MNESQPKEIVYNKILEDYSQYMALQVQRFNLFKYGLDPEDILQEVKVRIWRIVSSNRSIASPPAYIKRIISSAVIDQLRKLKRDDSLLLHERNQCISEQTNPYCMAALQRKSLVETIGRAADKLIDSRRQVVKLYLLNLNIREISSYLNWSQDKTRNLLYRGLADLRKSLRNAEMNHET